MSVHRRHYRAYEGRLTPQWSRLLVPARYSLETMFQSRPLIGFLVACCVWPLFCALAIYLHHNLDALSTLRLSAKSLLPIDNTFFFVYLNVQGVLAFLLTAYAGPSLVAPDLANNALPLYLCRPISRVDYVLGKMAVLALPLSAITWVPGLLLFVMQSSLEGNGWGWGHVGLVWALLAGSWLWILILALLSMALSAWVKWRMASTALLFVTFFLLAGFGAAINEVLRTKWGYLINLGYLMGTVWMHLFDADINDSVWGMFITEGRGVQLPLWSAWAMLGVLGALCVLLLERRLRAREVVR